MGWPCIDLSRGLSTAGHGDDRRDLRCARQLVRTARHPQPSCMSVIAAAAADPLPVAAPVAAIATAIPGGARGERWAEGSKRLERAVTAGRRGMDLDLGQTQSRSTMVGAARHDLQPRWRGGRDCRLLAHAEGLLVELETARPPFQLRCLHRRRPREEGCARVARWREGSRRWSAGGHSCGGCQPAVRVLVSYCGSDELQQARTSPFRCSRSS